MPRAPLHRDRLVQAAMRLLRHQGYAGTGLAEILTRSGAPRGSLYHYFPDGKEEIGAEAVATAGQVVSRSLRELLDGTDTRADFVQAYARRLARWMEVSDYRDGCPIATTLLEMAPASERITTAGRAAFEQWIELIAEAYARDGHDADAARQHATLLTAAVEGSLLLARVQRSTAPIEQMARLLG